MLLRAVKARDVAVGILDGCGTILHGLAERFLGEHKLRGSELIARHVNASSRRA